MFPPEPKANLNRRRMPIIVHETSMNELPHGVPQRKKTSENVAFMRGSETFAPTLF